MDELYFLCEVRSEVQPVTVKERRKEVGASKEWHWFEVAVVGNSGRDCVGTGQLPGRRGQEPNLRSKAIFRRNDPMLLYHFSGCHSTVWVERRRTWIGLAGGLGCCWTTAEGEQGSKEVDSTSKQISKGMSPGSSQNGENCEVMRGWCLGLLKPENMCGRTRKWALWKLWCSCLGRVFQSWWETLPAIPGAAFPPGLCQTLGVLPPSVKVCGDSSRHWSLVYIGYRSIIHGPAFIVRDSAVSTPSLRYGILGETGCTGSNLKPPSLPQYVAINFINFLPGSKAQIPAILGTHKPLPCPSPIMSPGSSFYSGEIFLLKPYPFRGLRPYRIRVTKPATHCTEARTK